MPRAKDRKSKLLKIECGLHLAQMIEPGLGAVASQIVGGIRHVLFGILDGLDELAGVKLDEVYGRLGEHGKARGTDFGEAALDEEAPMLTAGEADIEQPGTERGQNRRVISEHGHIALGARHQHLLDVVGDEQPFRRHQLEFERVRH